MLSLDADLSLGELETAANFLNENFRGWEIERVRAELRGRVEREQREYHRLLGSIEQLWMKAGSGRSAPDGLCGRRGKPGGRWWCRRS